MESRKTKSVASSRYGSTKCKEETVAHVVDLRHLPAMCTYFRVNPTYVTEKTPTLLSTSSSPNPAQYIPTLLRLSTCTSSSTLPLLGLIHSIVCYTVPYPYHRSMIFRCDGSVCRLGRRKGVRTIVKDQRQARLPSLLVSRDLPL